MLKYIVLLFFLSCIHAKLTQNQINVFLCQADMAKCNTTCSDECGDLKNKLKNECAQYKPVEDAICCKAEIAQCLSCTYNLTVTQYCNCINNRTHGCV